jgi:hypothetical protein
MKFVYLSPKRHGHNVVETMLYDVQSICDAATHLHYRKILLYVPHIYPTPQYGVDYHYLSNPFSRQTFFK